MDNVLEYMRDMDFTEPATREELEAVEKQMNIVFPEKYKSFMQKTNGAEGAIGDNSYLVIWTINELPELNEEYGVNEFTPGLIYFGSDGGDVAYAFDFRKNPSSIVEIPFDSIHIEEAQFISMGFDEFISKIYAQ